jgi:hypothetical protein
LFDKPVKVRQVAQDIVLEMGRQKGSRKEGRKEGKAAKNVAGCHQEFHGGSIFSHIPK